MSSDYSVRHGHFNVQAIVSEQPWYENCYIVRHITTGEQLIFDPGSNAEHVLRLVTGNGGKVDEILLTHAHPDHLGAVHALQDALGVECRVHERDEPLMSSMVRFAAAALGVQVDAPKSFATFGDDETFSLGGDPFSMVPCPGHTPGGVAYVFGGFALTGDTLFNHGVGRTDLPGGDDRGLVKSITTLLGRLPPDCQLYSGHGPSWTVDEAQAWWSQMRNWDSIF